VPLPSAEVRRVVWETRHARNASARRQRQERTEAERWCAEVGAAVRRWPHFQGQPGGGWRYTLTVPGFHPVTADTLERAVRALDQTIAAWCEGPAQRGPTGAGLARYRRLREGTDG
jgi:hypothetical protein